MVIEESVIVHARLPKVWDTFTNITCWDDWNTVIKKVSPGKTEILAEGGKVRFCMYPFHFPVYLEPVIEKVVPKKEVVWTSAKYGISARHAFVFEPVEDGVLVTSRETFNGVTVKALRFLFPEWRLRDLTVAFLRDLKGAAEA
jgi:hypothetical protein